MKLKKKLVEKGSKNEHNQPGSIYQVSDMSYKIEIISYKAKGKKYKI